MSAGRVASTAASGMWNRMRHTVGSIGKTADTMSDADIMRRGTKRMAWGGGVSGATVLMMNRRGTKTSGREGIQPHSMGGQTLYQ